MPFRDTTNKASIRRNWNLPILESWCRRVDRKLTYFGLPGEQICDILDWRNVLARQRTGVESPGRTKNERDQADETIGNLYTNVMVNDVSSGFELLIADVEDVIIEGHDDNGKAPQLSDGKAPHVARFSYDVVNLDFDGGLGYRSEKKYQGLSKRVLAIKKLFERQAGHSFVLFLTINIRHKLGAEIEDYLTGMQLRSRDVAWHDHLAWYLDRGEGELDHKMKAIVPTFIQAVSELHMFRCKCKPPIVYQGHEHARMMHFAIELESQPGSLRAFSPQDDLGLISMPLLCCKDGILRIARKQHPQYDPSTASQYFDFVSETVRETLLRSPTENTESR